jgi:hypothetical protein
MDIIVLHNGADRTSRDLVSACGDTVGQILDWYGDPAARAEYLERGLPAPSAFPSVVDADSGVLVQVATADEMEETLASAVTEAAAVSVRRRRDSALREHVDAINAVRWDSMDEATRDLWRAYRQALLDVPQQEAFPDEITWPEVPGDEA